MAKPSETRAVRKAPPRAPRKRAPTPQPAEQPMEIHKPKPIHSWRELASEIGVIVVGILIALGLEQAIESYRERQHAAETIKAIDGELRDNLARALTIIAMSGCTKRQVAALSDAVGRGDHPTVHKLLLADALPLPDAWPSGAWQAALATDVSNRFSERQRASYQIEYTFIDAAREKTIAYETALSRLRALALSGLNQSREASAADIDATADTAAALAELQGFVAAFPAITKYQSGIELSPAELAARQQRVFLQRQAKCRKLAAELDASGT